MNFITKHWRFRDTPFNRRLTTLVSVLLIMNIAALFFMFSRSDKHEEAVQASLNAGKIAVLTYQIEAELDEIGELTKNIYLGQRKDALIHSIRELDVDVENKFDRLGDMVLNASYKLKNQKSWMVKQLTEAKLSSREARKRTIYQVTTLNGDLHSANMAYDKEIQPYHLAAEVALEKVKDGTDLIAEDCEEAATLSSLVMKIAAVIFFITNILVIGVVGISVYANVNYDKMKK